MAATAVTPAGVRDGDPGALAALCEVRGPAVLAYCEVVAGRGDAGTAAAAEALGSFRAGVVATGDLGTLKPEALLISATRHAAARHTGGDLPAGCVRVPQLLAARADRSISLADHDWLEEHLRGCWTCRAPVARFDAADRAYLEPEHSTIPPEIAAAMVAAMTAAAPVRGAIPEPPAIAAPYVAPQPAPQEYANGSGAHAGHDAAAEPATSYEIPAVDQHTSAYEMPAEDAAGAPPADEPVPRHEPREPRAGRGSLLATFGLGKAAKRSSGAAGSPTATRLTRAPRAERGSGAAGAATAAEPRSGGTSLPRPRRAAVSGARARRGSGPLRPSVVLPIVLVILAILVALAIAGVFGGGDPASAPQSFAPSAGEPATTTTPVVVVPGARAASAAAVERAKARARAAKRRGAGAKAPQANTGTPARASVTTPPAAPAATSGAAAPAPPPPPPPATKAKPTGKGSAGTPKVDAGNGATGAEAPVQDTSTVPDLAPPVEPVDPPG